MQKVIVLKIFKLFQTKRNITEQKILITFFFKFTLKKSPFLVLHTHTHTLTHRHLYINTLLTHLALNCFYE